MLLRESGRRRTALSCENFNVKTAARRLTTTGEKRKAIFGKVCFTPMTPDRQRAPSTSVLGCLFAPSIDHAVVMQCFYFDALSLESVCSLDSNLGAFYLLQLQRRARSLVNGCVVL
jgi:hypothetical protein